MSRMKNEYIRLQETPIMDDCPNLLNCKNQERNCYECKDGKVPRLCECDEPVTLIMGLDATVCEMCRQ